MTRRGLVFVLHLLQSERVLFLMGVVRCLFVGLGLGIGW
nr:MAG TPA: hypothetical protein [Caudoviricetes sp.]